MDRDRNLGNNFFSVRPSGILNIQNMHFPLQILHNNLFHYTSNQTFEYRRIIGN